MGDRKDALSVRAEHCAPHRTGVALENLNLVTGLHVPDPGCSVSGSRYDASAVGAERCTINALMGEGLDLPPRGSVPDSRRIVGRYRDDASAVGAERCSFYCILMPGEGLYRLARFTVPQWRGIVAGGPDDSRSIAAERDAGRCSRENGDLPWRLDVPHLRRLARGGDQDATAIRTELCTLHRTFGGKNRNLSAGPVPHSCSLV